MKNGDKTDELEIYCSTLFIFKKTLLTIFNLAYKRLKRRFPKFFFVKFIDVYKINRNNNNI